LFDNNETVRRALALAEKAHEGQERKFDGTPYIEHPKRVATRVIEAYAHIGSFAPNPLVAAALLHDTLEALHYFQQTLGELGFGFLSLQVSSGLLCFLQPHRYPPSKT